jgi:hypothetical protein
MGERVDILSAGIGVKGEFLTQTDNSSVMTGSLGGHKSQLRDAELVERALITS